MQRADEQAQESEPRNNFSIRNRLYLGFAAIMVVVILAVGFTLYKVSSTEESVAQVVHTDFPSAVNLSFLYNAILSARVNLLAYMLTNEPVFKSNFENAIRQIEIAKMKVNSLVANWNAAEVATWQEINTLISQTESAQIKLMNAYNETNKEVSTKQWLTEVAPITNRLIDILHGIKNSAGTRENGLIDNYNDLFNNHIQIISNNMSAIKYIEYGVVLITLLATLIIGAITANAIVNPLQAAIKIAKSIAAGSRDIVIKVRSRDETGELLQALKTMQLSIKNNDEKLRQKEIEARNLSAQVLNTAEKFSEHSSKVASGDLTERLMIEEKNTMTQLGKDLNSMTESLANSARQINQACHNMVSTLDQVKQAVDTQSSGATEQAASVNQITASLAEIERSSAQTMEKAKKLGASAELTREVGQEGLNSVEQSIGSMKLIKEKVQTIAQTILDLSVQTQQVGEITAVVTNLAQRSKMLALNASIEAAKAGEAGKGFAVVASEVKNLAEQSESATDQVQKILSDIRLATERAVLVMEEGTKKVDQGTNLVEQTGEIVRNLSNVIYETTLATQQIEAAIKQEGVGIEQISTAMSEINQVTASFVASANQTLEAINNLSGIAHNLKEYADTYKV